MAFPLLAILDIGSKLINKFIPDPKARLEAQQKLLEMHQKGELAELSAAADIISNEAKSEHWIVSAWRPITMLTFVLIIANNYILAPYLDLFLDKSVVLDLPPDMWDLLKIGLGGYVVGRSGEKIMKEFKK